MTLCTTTTCAWPVCPIPHQLIPPSICKPLFHLYSLKWPMTCNLGSWTLLLCPPGVILPFLVISSFYSCTCCYYFFHTIIFYKSLKLSFSWSIFLLSVIKKWWNLKILVFITYFYQGDFICILKLWNDGSVAEFILYFIDFF